MKKYIPGFCFKGNRNYVHGTDIFNKLIELFGNELNGKKIDLSFHGIAKTNLDLIADKPAEELIKFVFKYKDTTESCTWYGIENHKKIDCRYEYPEEKIYKLSVIDKKAQRVSLENETGFTFIENIVALNKYLLQNLYNNLNGKWYFTRLQMESIPFRSSPVALELQANFNFKLTKSAIFYNKKNIGYIYFSLV